MTKSKFATAYGQRKVVQMEPKGESLTQQNFKAETDIRTIIRKYDQTGLITNVAKGIAHYGDYSEANEYREALDIVNNANATFMQLPAELRKQFGNDAGEFFEFATNPANKEKLVEMGLAKPEPSLQEDASTPAPTKEKAVGSESSLESES